MANEKLIRASEARKAILNADPKLAFCIDNIKAVGVPKTPCDLCRFNPPSSCDGKPCTMCVAERRAE